MSLLPLASDSSAVGEMSEVSGLWRAHVSPFPVCPGPRSQPGTVLCCPVCVGVEVGVTIRADPTLILCRIVKQILVRQITFFYEYVIIRSLDLCEVTSCKQQMAMINLHNLKYLKLILKVISKYFQIL